MSTTLYPVILSGGSGTRLWPLSRDLFPKQLLPLVQEKSLLAATAERVSGKAFAAPIIVCNQDHRFMVAEQLGGIGVKPEAIILEPIARNTAPAIAATAALLLARDSGALMLVLPSDHIILDEAAFAHAIAVAARAAEAGHLVTFGINPTAPETGYGYIHSAAPIAGIAGAFGIARFVEKPDAATAAGYLAEGGWSWNSGMFVFPAALLLKELKRFEPELVAASEQSVTRAHTDGDFVRLNKDSFATAPAKSIDYALMERTAHAAVVPADLGWSDIGSWSALWELGEKDSRGNVTIGRAIAEDTDTSYLRSQGPLVTTLGVKDLIVVATGDVVMVAAKNRAQDVKTLVTRVRAAGGTEATAPAKANRSWGTYETVDSASDFDVRRVAVNPGASLPLQQTTAAIEHWVVLHGSARVTQDGTTQSLGAGMSRDFAVGDSYRLENTGKEPLHLIQVRSGANLVGSDLADA